jgi:uncharacterized protein
MLTLDRARAWYIENDAVHGFDHIERVYSLCETIGEKEGADLEILRAAALLHDARGSHPELGQRENHHVDSAAFAQEILSQEGWPSSKISAVQHCILSHRFRKDAPPETIEARVLFDADKLDVIGAIGVVRALAYAFQAKTPAFALPSEQFMQGGKVLPGEAHSAYHEYIFKLKHISSLLFTETAKEIAVQRQAFLNAFFDELKSEMQIEK